MTNSILLFQNFSFFVILIISICLMIFAFTAYRRFEKGEFKNILLYVILAFYMSGFSFLARGGELIFGMKTENVIVVDHTLYLFAIIFSIISVYYFYKFSIKYGIKGIKK